MAENYSLLGLSGKRLCRGSCTSLIDVGGFNEDELPVSTCLVVLN